MLKGFLITSEYEKERAANVDALLGQLPGIKKQKAVYPAYERVPFLAKIKEGARRRYQTDFLDGEIGILLSNRRVWMQIANSDGPDDEHFLILESDSQVNQLKLLVDNYKNATAGYDLFFWGAWMGYMRLLRSSIKPLDRGFSVGVPYMRSVSCAYGYSINRKAARHLLQCTGTLRYPVDEFKRYIKKGYLQVGGVSPELISQATIGSTIDPTNQKERTNYTWIKLLDIRNRIICYFS
jgi:GR25 family glycosyltransferase involved in LPS biosynthesis